MLINRLTKNEIKILRVSLAYFVGAIALPNQTLVNPNKQIEIMDDCIDLAIKLEHNQNKNAKT